MKYASREIFRHGWSAGLIVRPGMKFRPKESENEATAATHALSWLVDLSVCVQHIPQQVRLLYAGEMEMRVQLAMDLSRTRGRHVTMKLCRIKISWLPIELIAVPNCYHTPDLLAN